MSITPPRQKQFNFVSYFNTGAAITIESANPHHIESIKDLCGLQVGVTKGSLNGDNLKAYSDKNCGSKPVQLTYFETTTDAQQAFRSGRTVAMFDDFTPAAYAAQQSDGQVKVIGKVYFQSPYGIAVQAGQVQFVRCSARPIQRSTAQAPATTRSCRCERPSTARPGILAPVRPASALLASQAHSALPTPLRLVLVALLVLGAGVWIGGMAAVTVLSVASRRVLSAGDRTRLFRDFGRHYLTVAGTALVMAVVCGAVLLIARGWDGLATAIAAVTVVLAAALVFGVRQARAIGRLRRAMAGHETGAASQPVTGAGPNAELAARTRHARLLRASLGLLTAALFVLSICTAG